MAVVSRVLELMVAVFFVNGRCAAAESAVSSDGSPGLEDPVIEILLRTATETALGTLVTAIERCVTEITRESDWLAHKVYWIRT